MSRLDSLERAETRCLANEKVMCTDAHVAEVCLTTMTCWRTATQRWPIFFASLTWVLGKEPSLHSRLTTEQITEFVHKWLPTGTFPQGRVCVERTIPQLDGSFKHTLQLAALGVCLGVVSNLLSSFGTKFCLAAGEFF